jgi:mono/diheme cytochrome c family protein
MSMPPGNPETVSEQRHYDITAFLLAEAGLLAEGQVVSADTAAELVFQAAGEPAMPEQVVAGEKAYNKYCGGCHGGGFSESSVKRYGTAEKLFGFLRMSMPPGNPTQVSEQSHYDIVAYMLSEHDLLEAGEIVSADSAGDVTFGD